ncbi:hypothetical protein [Microcystis phage Mwe-JY26]
MSSNAVTKTGSNALAPHGGNPFASAADDLGASGGLYMKFNGNTGDFTAGAESDEVPHETKLVAMMDGFSRGWICWVDNEVVDEVMVPVIEGKPPAESDLEDHAPPEGYAKHADGTEDGWSEQAKLVFRSLETGEDLIFKTSSKSGLRALGNLARDYGRQFRNHPDELPIIELSALDFVPKANKKIGKKYAPVFKIVDWISVSEVEALADNAGSGEEDPGNYASGEPKQEQTAPQAETEAEQQTRRPVAPQQPAADAPQGRRGKRF